MTTKIADSMLINAAGVAAQNILINGSFEIWQRGNTFTYGSGGGVYGPDRWSYPGLPGASSVTISQESAAANVHDGLYSMKLNCTAIGSSSNLYMTYQVENWQDYAGKTVSFSAWVKTTMANVVIALQNGIYASNVHPGDGAWHLLSLTVTLPSNITFLNAFCPYIITGLTTGIIYVDGAMLVLSPVPVNFVARFMALELLLCQRYYEKSFDLATVPAAGTTNVGRIKFHNLAASSVDTTVNIAFKVTKRVAPTMISYKALSGAGVAVFDNVGTNGGNMFISALVPLGVDWQHWTADAEM